VEVAVREVRVKRKFSQNRSPGDRAGVIAGLMASDDAADRMLGEAMTQDAPS
jgi:predicted FMN-binding regulatory protein PaiB